METRKNRGLTLGWRVSFGLGFWAVGACGLAAGFTNSFDIAQARMAHYGAELSGDGERLTAANNALERSQTNMWVHLATGAMSMAAGACLTRGIEGLWSGPLAGQEAIPSIATNVVVVVDFQNHRRIA